MKQYDQIPMRPLPNDYRKWWLSHPRARFTPVRRPVIAQLQAIIAKAKRQFREART